MHRIDSPLSSGQSGRDYYAGVYRGDLQREAEWLRRTAPQKAAAIQALLSTERLRPQTVLEIGAGTGAVIARLRRVGVGISHFAVDFSQEAIDELRRTEAGIQATVADIMVTPDPFATPGGYDLMVASHVVEHLEEPETFLGGLRAVPAPYLIVEVPLENLPLGRLKARFSDRSRHPAGHVQFFDRSTCDALIRRAGWQIVRSHAYAPYLDRETFQFAYGSSGMTTRLIKRCTEDLGPRLFGAAWTRFYHAHYAVLCTR
ncbi:MAG: class I SAM-dependent methyltransferase [Rhodothermales bacterium]